MLEGNNKRERAIELIESWMEELNEKENTEEFEKKEQKEIEELDEQQVYSESIPLVLTANDISKILRLSRPKVYEIMKAPDFPLIMLGRSKRVLTEDFIEWLKEKRVRSN